MPLPRRFRKAALGTDQQGYFRHLPRHFVTHYERGSTLIVSFDNMKSRDLPAPRYPWGFDFIKARGHSHLGIMMKRRNDWFRHGELFDFFDELAQSGFFAKFDRVLFYGSSMGGYGALSFASAAPRAQVLAYVPQTTLAPQIVPWETRYANGRARGDWDDRRYEDAAATIAQAGQVHMFYDPYETLDRRHADRLRSANVNHYHVPFSGHKAPRVLHFVGILGDIFDLAIAGNLTPQRYAELFRARRNVVGWQRLLASRALEQGKTARAERILRQAQARREDWVFPQLYGQIEEHIARRA